MLRLWRLGWVRLLLVAVSATAAVVALRWRGPDWDLVAHAFSSARWRWIAVAAGLNLASVLVRSLSWNLTIRSAVPLPHPAFRHVFSAFAVGLLGNAALPARAGELARVAVLRRHVNGGRGAAVTLAGTVFAHRLFDLFAVAALVVYTLTTARIPHWAMTALTGIAIVGVPVLVIAVAVAHDRGRAAAAVENTVLRLVAMGRQGLAVLRTKAAAVGAIVLQMVGWFLQLLAVWAVTEAFSMDVPLPAAALVLLLMNIATVFPLWPGNVGLLQAAVALPLVQYGVAYGTGFAYGLALQALEMSVGVGIGLIFLAREGLSFRSLRTIDDGDEDAADEPDVARVARDV